MVTENQKKVFGDYLNNTFNLRIKNNTETYNKTNTWLKNVYYRYKNSTLPKEHKEKLETRLKKYNITIDEFLETKGNLNSLRILSKKKKELKEIARKQEKEKQKEKNKNIKQLQHENKVLKENIQKLKQNTPNIKQLENENKVLRSNIQKQKEKNKNIIRSNEKLITQNQKLKYRAKYVEELNRDLAKEIESSKQLKDNKNRTIEKEHILDLLCSYDNLSIQEIKDSLETANISTDNLLNTLREIRSEIPSITSIINEDGKTQKYSIIAKNTKRLTELREMTFCPSISNIHNGKIKFIVLSDLHIKDNTLDTMKKTLEPSLNLSTKEGNIAIVNLGDTQDSISIMKNRLNIPEKEVIKYSYKFWENYAKAISMAPKIEHYDEFGNHDEESFHIGIDSLEIINSNCDNFTFLGVNEGAIKIGNDKIGIYHKVNSIPNIRNHNYYTKLCEEAKVLIRDYIFFLMGHFHFGEHNPLLGYSLINNGIENALLFTAEVEDGNIERMYIDELSLVNNKYIQKGYQIEIYNKSALQYIKK